MRSPPAVGSLLRRHVGSLGTDAAVFIGPWSLSVPLHSGIGASPVTVVICWPHISGYMAACWRAISERADLKLSIVGFKSHGVKGHDIQFQDEIVRGLNVRLLAPEEIADAALVKSLVVQQAPDV